MPSDAPVAAEIPAVAAEAIAAPAVETAVPAAEAAPATPATEAPAVVKTEPAEQKSEPSLLESAEGKKPEAKTETKVSEPSKDGKDTSAPAEAKPEPKSDKPEAKAEAKKDEGKKDEAKATDQTKEATASQPPAPVKYEAFKVPDGIKLEDEKLAKFTEIVGTRQIPQEDAQNLIDLYIQERKSDVERAQAEQRRVWNALNDTWKTDLRKDTEIGGNRLETSLSMAKAVVEEYLKPQEARELLAHMSNNGMGNFKPMVRLLHNIGKSLNIFEDGMVPANPTAPKMPKSPGNRGWYDKSEMGNGAAKP